jgi:NagD protein
VRAEVPRAVDSCGTMGTMTTSDLPQSADVDDVLTRRTVSTWLTDMDGVLVHEQQGLPGAAEFIAELTRCGRRYLVLTNNSIYTPRDLRARLSRSGIDLPESAIWTSALATAQFLSEQSPGSSAYVIGEAGLTSAMHDVGFVLSDEDVEFVVLGETRTYSFEAIARAIRLIDKGAKFIATNPDVTGPSAEGPLPATGAVAAMITAATKISPYYVGKPNPLMMRTALNRIGAHSETTIMIGDRMDTDVRSGLEAGMRTILVMTGSTRPEDIRAYPYRPSRVLDSIADVVPLVDDLTPLESQELEED